MRPGDDATTPRLPATLGGPGFRTRTRSHRADVEEGRIWRSCGYASETAPLLEVVMGWPPDTLVSRRPADEDLLLERPDLRRMRAQALLIEGYFRAHGVSVHWVCDAEAPPNIVFMRDLFFMTPEGAIIARPAAHQRAGEARIVAARLAELGAPILATVHGRGCFEGADALWLDDRTVLIGLGRTNEEGAAQVEHVLSTIGATAIRVAVPPRIQHLLGAVTLVEPGCAILHARAEGTEIETVLRAHGIYVAILEEDDELTLSRAMNLVVLDGGKFVMPAGAPRAADRYRRTGWSPDALEIGEYLKCGGGLGCLVGIFRRRTPAAED
ncbi:MAG: hypothetical protein KF795_02945 [Labilithrix sp.]|nr:hypothetical protein [Labilithrix sp.]